MFLFPVTNIVPASLSLLFMFVSGHCVSLLTHLLKMIHVACLSVCLSVCLSGICWCLSSKVDVLLDVPFLKKFFIVIQLQLCAFSPHPSTPPQLNTPPSPTSTLPLDLVHVSFKVVPVIHLTPS